MAEASFDSTGIFDPDNASAALDRSEFALFQVDEAGRVHFRNESAAERFLVGPANGQDFFRVVAPAGNVPAFRGRFLAGVRNGALDEAFAFVMGDGERAARFEVRMRLAQRPGRYWIGLRVRDVLGSTSRGPATHAVDSRATARPVDPRLCEDEPIHVPGAIQPHAVLLAVDDPSLAIVGCSVNLGEVFALTPDEIIGCPLGEVLPRSLADDIRQSLTGDPNTVSMLRRAIRIGGEGRKFFVSAHRHAGRLIVEIELLPDRAEDFAGATQTQTQAAVTAVRAEQTFDAALQAAADQMRDLTGFERVLVYRFDEEWNGEALAESTVSDWGDHLKGLRFPASDIPPQARALYTKNQSRFVIDRDYVPIPIVMAARTADIPLDLTFAEARSLSPIHLEYQRNLGVNGSMSVSIMVEDRLWGLMIGHHRRPHYLTPETRAAATILTATVGLRIQEIESRALWEKQRTHLGVQTSLLRQMARADDFAATLTDDAVTLLDLFDASGAAVVRDGSMIRVGVTPEPEVLTALSDWLRAQAGPDAVVANDRVSQVFSRGAADREIASGVLAAFVKDGRGAVILWFKPEVVSTVVWGGNPHKSVLGTSASAAVLPRRSFERWVEERRGYSTPWPEWQVDIARTLVQAIEGVILRQQSKIDLLNAKQAELLSALQDKDRLLEQKDLLGREIDHRVKNSLQIVAAFLRMQEQNAHDPEVQYAFSKSFARVMSVARVHDRLYQSEKVEAVDLGQTIEALCRDLGEMAGEDREITVTASPALMVPYGKAVPLALITTELVTNALKYAYASNERGTVSVSLSPEPTGGMRLVVADQGRGMPTLPTTAPRRGLGMRLVNAMLGQIDARMTVESNGGAKFVIHA